MLTACPRCNCPPEACCPCGCHETASRAAELLEQESSEAEGLWWLSFVDPGRPEGERFLGACIVKARGFLGATFEAWRRGCNPGGEVKGAGPMPLDDGPDERWRNRLLSRAECDELELEMNARDAV